MDSALLRTKIRPAQGFTIIEMVVVLAIITIVLSVILVSSSTFNRTLLLTDTAYTMALSIRESQSIGLSSRVYAGQQNPGLGIHLEGAAPLKNYLQFDDFYPTAGSSVFSFCPGHTESDPNNPEARAGDCIYENNPNEMLQQYNFSQGYTIGRYCVSQAGGTPYCSPYLTGLDIVFQRPNTQTVIIGHNTNGVIGHAYDTACIEIDAPAGASAGTRSVVVTQLGEVLVSQTLCK